MTTPKRFTLPDIAREELTLQELELVALLEEMVEMTNRLQEDVERLEQEVARLKKGKRHS